jgi:hypothetical protein
MLQPLCHLPKLDSLLRFLALVGWQIIKAYLQGDTGNSVPRKKKKQAMVRLIASFSTSAEQFT